MKLQVGILNIFYNNAIKKHKNYELNRLIDTFGEFVTLGDFRSRGKRASLFIFETIGSPLQNFGIEMVLENLDEWSFWPKSKDPDLQTN